MAKVSFTHITPVKDIEDKKITFNDKEVIIKQYLPIKEKAELVDYVVQSSFDAQGLFSPIRQNIYTTLGLLKWYTNINFTDTMMQNIEKTYDLIIINHIGDILADIDEEERINIQKMIIDAINEAKDYIRSFAGQLQSVQNDYDETKFDLEEITKSLEDPNKIGFVKELMEKMG